MTSRERVIAALKHEPTDKIPVDFGAMGSTGINVTAYANLKKYLGFSEKPFKMYDSNQQLAEPEAELVQRLGGDMVQVERVNEYKEVTLKNGLKVLAAASYNPILLEDGSQIVKDADNRVIVRMPKDSDYFDLEYFPLANAQTVEDIEKFNYAPVNEQYIDFMVSSAKKLRETTEKAIVLPIGGNILEGGETTFGFEKFMELLALEPQMVHQWAEKTTAYYLYFLKRIMPKIKDYVDIVQFGDDLGTQTSLIVSAEMYRERIKPYHKVLYGFIRNSYPDHFVVMHSCGAIEPLIGDLIDCGVQGLNPIQISAKNMEPSILKKKYGKDITFYGGGINMQHTVVHGSLKDIEEEVKNNCNIFYGDKTGFIFTQVHNIQSNVSPAKIMAIYDTVRNLNMN